MSKPVKMDILHKKLVAIFSRPFVFIRHGRTLRPMLASPALGTPASRESADGKGADPVPGQSPAPDGESDGDSAGTGLQPLTRHDLGLR